MLKTKLFEDWNGDYFVILLLFEKRKIIPGCWIKRLQCILIVLFVYGVMMSGVRVKAWDWLRPFSLTRV